MKKRGFTLVEMIAVLGIISILLSIGVVGIKIFRERYKEIETKGFFYEVTDMLVYGKKYCISNNVCGIVNFYNDEDNLKVSLFADSKLVRNIDLRKVLKIKSFNYEEKIKSISLSINQAGYLEPGSIKLVNEKNEIFKITVQVGSNVITVKEGER